MVFVVTYILYKFKTEVLFLCFNWFASSANFCHFWRKSNKVQMCFSSFNTWLSKNLQSVSACSWSNQAPDRFLRWRLPQRSLQIVDLIWFFVCACVRYLTLWLIHSLFLSDWWNPRTSCHQVILECCSSCTILNSTREDSG